MDKIKLLDGKEWDKQELLDNMMSDDFYYGYLSKAALSSSSAKMLISRGEREEVKREREAGDKEKGEREKGNIGTGEY